MELAHIAHAHDADSHFIHDIQSTVHQLKILNRQYRRQGRGPARLFWAASTANNMDTLIRSDGTVTSKRLE
jgi:hypothetical protein